MVTGSTEKQVASGKTSSFFPCYMPSSLVPFHLDNFVAVKVSFNKCEVLVSEEKLTLFNKYRELEGIHC